MNEQLLKTSGADVLSSRRKLRKTLRGGIPTPPPPYLVRPRLNDTTSLLTLKMTNAQTSVIINHYPTEDNTSKTIISKLLMKEFTGKKINSPAMGPPAAAVNE